MAKPINRKNKYETPCSSYGPTPSAHTITLCNAPATLNTNIHSRVSELLNSTALSSIDKLAIELLYLNGLRISEVLNIRYSNIRRDGSIFIKALKGSNDRLVYTHSNIPKHINDGYNTGLLFDGYTRYYYHRLFVKLGLYERNVGSNKRIVTHIFRHNYLTSIYNDYNDIDLTKRQIGHVSSSSTIHYIGNNKQKR